MYAYSAPRYTATLEICSDSALTQRYFGAGREEQFLSYPVHCMFSLARTNGKEASTPSGMEDSKFVVQIARE